MKRSQISILLFFIVVIVSSCTYDFIKVEEAPPIDPNANVSFAQQILPILDNNGNCTSCHRTGGQSPDYTTANAYNSIISNNLVNTAAPESSVLYALPAPATSSHSWKKYTASQAQLVLLWIQQGAKNN